LGAVMARTRGSKSNPFAIGGNFRGWGGLRRIYGGDGMLEAASVACDLIP